MPLEQSADREAVGRNISMLEAEGKKPKAAIAVALSIARRNGAKIPPPKRRYKDNAKFGS